MTVNVNIKTKNCTYYYRHVRIIHISQCGLLGYSKTAQLSLEFNPLGFCQEIIEEGLLVRRKKWFDMIGLMWLTVDQSEALGLKIPGLANCFCCGWQRWCGLYSSTILPSKLCEKVQTYSVPFWFSHSRQSIQDRIFKFQTQ